MRGILGIRCRKAEGMKAVIANTHHRSAYDDLYRGLRQRYARHKLGCFAACCDRTTGFNHLTMQLIDALIESYEMNGTYS